MNAEIEHLLAILRLASRNIRVHQAIETKTERKLPRSENSSGKRFTDEELQDAYRAH